MASPLSYREFPPIPPLLPHLECVWVLSGTGPGPAPVLPDGSPELILHLGDPVEAAMGEERPARQPAAHFVGQ